MNYIKGCEIYTERLYMRKSSNVIEKIGLKFVGIKEYFGLQLKYFEILNNKISY